MAKMNISGAKYGKLIARLENMVEFKREGAKLASDNFMESGMLSGQADDLESILKDAKALKL